MPHRVTSFLRNSSNSLENQVQSIKKAATRKHSRSSERVFSYASSIDDDADEAHNNSNNYHHHPVMKTAVPPARRSGTMDSSSASSHDGHGSHHRLSLPGLHFGRSSKESHAASTTHPAASLDWKVESPPIVLYGDAENSSGALVSGQLFLNIKEDGLAMESFVATLKIHVTQKRPFSVHCAECTNQYTEIQKWKFFDGPLSMTKGEHAFPFSVLLPGHLPATLDNTLVTIAYEFKAEAVPKTGPALRLDKLFDVKRSLPVPELPHHSVRVFPPTNIKASVHFPQVIHPIGANTLSLKMDGVAKSNPRNSTVEYWKLKKLMWRLEETGKTVAPACAKHTPKDKDEDAAAAATEEPRPRKGVQRTDVRIIGEKTMFNGWKSSYGAPDAAAVEIELDYHLSRQAKFACDSKSRDGTEVTHQLMVEMVVSQEWAPVGKPALVTQTGVGRILRMHFATVLTERGGIGISWDNEAPPIYQDVPPSPPAYCGMIREAEGEGSISDEEGFVLDRGISPELGGEEAPAYAETDGAGPSSP